MTHQLQQQRINTSDHHVTSSWIEFVTGAAWCVPDLLSQKECSDMIELATLAGIQEKKMAGDTRHRQRVRLLLEAPEILSVIWDRVKDKVPQEIVIDVDNIQQMQHLHESPDSPHDFIGRWTPSGMKGKVEIAYCSEKGHLAAHRDGVHVVNEHERSFLTISGFLTSRPSGLGGATRFLKDDIRVESADILIREEHILYKVESDQAGRAAVFFHGLLHDGEPLAENSPPKWIFIASVYYRRDPETAPTLSEDQTRARQFLDDAMAAEEEGKLDQATQFYKQAYRLDPLLEFN